MNSGPRVHSRPCLKSTVPSLVSTSGYSTFLLIGRTSQLRWAGVSLPEPSKGGRRHPFFMNADPSTGRESSIQMYFPSSRLLQAHTFSGFRTLHAKRGAKNTRLGGGISRGGQGLVLSCGYVCTAGDITTSRFALGLHYLQFTIRSITLSTPPPHTEAAFTSVVVTSPS